MYLPWMLKFVWGSDHLLNHLNDIVRKGGEGLMLVKPQSFHFEGRTDSVLKVKVNDLYW